MIRLKKTIIIFDKIEISLVDIARKKRYNIRMSHLGNTLTDRKGFAQYPRQYSDILALIVLFNICNIECMYTHIK